MDCLTAFLEAIRADPKDDACRLVFSDWLDEQGEATWAELIRLQCELCNLRSTDPRRDGLRARESLLLKACQDRWLAPLREQGLSAVCTFSRGFIDRAELERATQKELSPEALPTFLSLPICGALASLKTTIDNLGDPVGRAVASTPSLSGLVELELEYPNMGDAGMAELAQSPYLGNLRTLRIVSAYSDWHHRHIGGAGARSLAESPTLSRLEELDLTYNAVDETGIWPLSRSQNVLHMRKLKLSGNQLYNGGAVALASSPYLTRLEELDLGSNEIGDEGIEALAASPVLASVTVLDLSSHHIIGQNWFGERGAIALARSPYLGQLSELRLGEAQDAIGAAGMDALRQRFGERLELFED
jgi:uncharacterized protein (TIGR02996 family)